MLTTGVDNQQHEALQPAPADSSAVHWPELSGLIQQLRQRWRLRLLLNGIFSVLLIGALLIGIETWLLSEWHFAQNAVWLLRAVTVFGLVALLMFYCVTPLRRQVSDAQVALYFEEHEPELKSIISSAVDAGRDPTRDLSPQLVQALVKRALEASAAVDDGNRIEQRKLTTAGLKLGLLSLVLAGLAIWQPFLLGHGAPALLMPWTNASQYSPYEILISPGDIEIARGGDLLVGANIEGFDGDDVTLLTSADGGNSWQSTPMTFGAAEGQYEAFLFDIADDFDYYVEAVGQQSPIHRVTVADIPAIEEIGLRYHFPAYTRLESESSKGSGDITALRGTRVEVLIKPTIDIPGGELRLADGRSIELEQREDKIWLGKIAIEESGAYHVWLQRPSGIAVNASPEYRITMLDDLQPSVSILSPGRDSKVSMIEEALMKIRASDDQGIADLELVLSVNGEGEQIVKLLRDENDPDINRQVDAEHVIYLEDLNLRPGDLISYYVNATDRAPAEQARTATSDIFFYQVRPFDTNYRRAEQQGGGGGAGGGQNGQGEGFLSEQQKQFVIATFKMIRDRDNYDADSYQEHLDLLARAEARIRDRVEAILRRISGRPMARFDERYQVIKEELPLAAEKMVEVENQLRQTEVQAALADAQVALKHLQRADAAFKDINVALNNQNGSGSGRSSGFEDLANLFQLEMDKLRHQYETVQRGQQQQSPEAQIDETLEKLRELARRQQQEIERRMRAQGQAGNDASRQRQLALAEQLEEMARQLERLSREQSNPRMQQSADQMRRAAEAMRQAANNSGGGRGGVDQARQAARDLQEAQRLLDQSKTAQFSDALERSLNRAELVEKQQARIKKEVSELDDEWGDKLKSQIKQVKNHKRELLRELTNLENELSELSTAAAEEQPQAQQSLKQAIRAAREHRLHDRINRTKEMMLLNQHEAALKNETRVQQGIAQMRESIEAAMANVADPENRGLQRSLEQMRAMARELQYLRERSETEGQQAGNGNTQRNSQASIDGESGNPFPQDYEGLVERSGQLRGSLINQGVEPGDIDPVIDKIRQLTGTGGDSNIASTELQEAALRALMELEYKLRRQLESHEYPELLIADPSELPDEYRDMVADYFRSLNQN